MRCTRLAVLTAHSSWLRALAFSPDGRTMASGGDDGAVMVGDVASRTPVAALRGHHASVNDVAFSPDGRTLASTGADSTVRLWDVECG